MLTRLGSLLLAIPVFVLGCQGGGNQVAADPAATMAADRAAIDSVNTRFLASMQASDCSALRALLTNDAVFHPPNGPDAIGIDAVGAWCESVNKMVKTTAVASTGREVLISGDLALDFGSFSWTVAPIGGGPEVTDQGRYVAVLRKQADGTWKVIRDLWSSSLPMAAPPKS